MGSEMCIRDRSATGGLEAASRLPTMPGQTGDVVMVDGEPKLLGGMDGNTFTDPPLIEVPGQTGDGHLILTSDGYQILSATGGLEDIEGELPTMPGQAGHVVMGPQGGTMLLTADGNMTEAPFIGIPGDFSGRLVNTSDGYQILSATGGLEAVSYTHLTLPTNAKV